MFSYGPCFSKSTTDKKRLCLHVYCLFVTYEHQICQKIEDLWNRTDHCQFVADTEHWLDLPPNSRNYPRRSAIPSNTSDINAFWKTSKISKFFCYSLRFQKQIKHYIDNNEASVHCEEHSVGGRRNRLIVFSPQDLADQSVLVASQVQGIPGVQPPGFAFDSCRTGTLLSHLFLTVRPGQ